jgi:hypothetical protein
LRLRVETINLEHWNSLSKKIVLSSDPQARVARLNKLYHAAFAISFDEAEFLADDFYAFQVLERVFGVEKAQPELFNLAVLIHAERKALMEGGMEAALEAAKTKWREMEAARLTAEERAVPSSLAASSSIGQSTNARTQPNKTLDSSEERRRGKVRMSNKDITLLSALRRLYMRTFNEPLDVEEFAGNDLYARIILTRAFAGGHQDLTDLAAHFMSADGSPRLHRRAGAVDFEFSVNGARGLPAT